MTSFTGRTRPLLGGMNSQEATGRQDDVGGCDARPGLRDAEAKVLYEISSRASTPTRTDRTHPRTSCGRSLRIGLPEAVASDIELLATEIVSNAVRQRRAWIHQRKSSCGSSRTGTSASRSRIQALRSNPNWAGLNRARAAGDCSWSTPSRRHGAWSIGKKVWFELG